MQVRRLYGWLMLAISALSNAESVVEVVPVYNRPAAELQPLIAPLLENTDAIVPNGDTIIVKTTPERLKTLTDLIQQLDSPLTNLQITVIQSRELTASQLNAGINLGFDLPPTGISQGSGYASAHLNRTQQALNNRNAQTIRTLEGVPAQIKAGRVIPVTSYQGYRDQYGYAYQNRSTQLIEATTGFSVTPSVSGQQVTLDVSPWSDRFDVQGRLQTQEAETTIRANLGEWVEIGAVEESGQGSTAGIASANGQTFQNTLRILVKVDRVR